MEWIQAHWTEIMAIVGGAYAVALVIVKLTPTPKDDKAMGNVNVLLKLIAAAFGLDLKQGLNSKPPSIKLVLPFLLPLFLLGGCVNTGLSDGQKLIIAADTWGAVTREVAKLNNEGHFGAKERQIIGILNDRGEKLLLEMDADYAAGKTFDFTYTLTKLQSVLNELLRMRLQTEQAINAKSKETSNVGITGSSNRYSGNQRLDRTPADGRKAYDRAGSRARKRCSRRERRVARLAGQNRRARPAPSPVLAAPSPSLAGTTDYDFD